VKLFALLKHYFKTIWNTKVIEVSRRWL